jgi:hypothetical protein
MFHGWRRFLKGTNMHYSPYKHMEASDRPAKDLCYEVIKSGCEEVMALIQHGLIIDGKPITDEQWPRIDRNGTPTRQRFALEYDSPAKVADLLAEFEDNGTIDCWLASTGSMLRAKDLRRKVGLTW